MKKLLLILCTATILFSSCDFVTGERVKGNGNVKTEERSETGFTGVVSGINFETYVGIGPYAVKIEAEENIIPYIETFVDNGVLKIHTKDGFWLKPRRTVKVYVTAPRLNKINSEGNGNVFSTTKITDSARIDLNVGGNAKMKVEVDAPEIDADLGGNGGIEIKGQTRDFKCKITGNGEIEAFDLQTESASMEVMGNGNANVTASVKLDVRITGNGNVRYKGNAQTSTHITGNGNVRKVD
ncbi:DUF2807 domain-containing protein [Pseudoflavitalea sp. X16]|uniref:head GIN domain-containing protein n=1 Tax=Paraflavitalea devenefica TaxID=2716334 RepID=UPI00141E27B5|nr:head GIN domain-containing protein [Paraflavitalea devenefica]NII27164.1 DUF2807 domain-containing protein [Paraflavitalea devenefica]